MSDPLLPLPKEWKERAPIEATSYERTETVGAVLNDRHLKAVDFLQVREHPSEGVWRAMRPPVKFSKTPATAAVAWQDTREIVCE